MLVNDWPMRLSDTLLVSVSHDHFTNHDAGIYRQHFTCSLFKATLKTTALIRLVVKTLWKICFNCTVSCTQFVNTSIALMSALEANLQWSEKKEGFPKSMRVQCWTKQCFPMKHRFHHKWITMYVFTTKIDIKISFSIKDFVCPSQRLQHFQSSSESSTWVRGGGGGVYQLCTSLEMLILYS